MLRKPLAWIVVICLNGVVVAGLWFIFYKGDSPENHGRVVSQEEGRVAPTVPLAVPAVVVPAADPTPTQVAPSLAPVPSAPRLTPTAGIPSEQSSAATPGPVPSVSVTPGAVAERTVDPSVARFADVRIPLDTREAEIRALAVRGDGEAIRILTTLANQDVYLNRAAVEALGMIRDPAVATFLRSKLGDVNTHDVTLLCECIRSAGKVLGDEAVVAIGDVMKAARNRNDGHAVAIRAACIRTMGELRRGEAVSLLQEELDYLCAQKRPDLAYGAEIVKAYGLIADKRAANRLIKYADFLDQHKPSQPEPRAFYEEKIKEARDTAQQLMQAAPAAITSSQREGEPLFH